MERWEQSQSQLCKNAALLQGNLRLRGAGRTGGTIKQQAKSLSVRRMLAYGAANATAIPKFHIFCHIKIQNLILSFGYTWVWCAGVVICLERGADLHIAQLIPLPLTVSCFSEIQIGFTFLVPAHPGSPGKRAVKQVCVFGYTLGYQLTQDVSGK